MACNEPHKVMTGGETGHVITQTRDIILINPLNIVKSLILVGALGVVGKTIECTKNKI